MHFITKYLFLLKAGFKIQRMFIILLDLNYVQILPNMNENNVYTAQWNKQPKIGH